MYIPRFKDLSLGLSLFIFSFIRVDFSHLSDEDPDVLAVMNQVNAKEFIPNADDRKAIMEEFQIFISRYGKTKLKHDNVVRVGHDPFCILCECRIMKSTRIKRKFHGTFPANIKRKCHSNLKW